MTPLRFRSRLALCSPRVARGASYLVLAVLVPGGLLLIALDIYRRNRHASPPEK